MICFTIGSCVVKIRFLFFAVLAFLLFSALGEGAILGLLAALLHELGHLAAMVGVGMPPREIRLNPFGVDLVKQETTGRSYGKEVLVSLAGPLANGLACFFCLLGRRLGWWEGDGWLMANAALGLMNLLPIEALDGGQALFSLLLLRSRRGEAFCGKVVTAVSFLTLLPLATAGFWLLLDSRYNFSLLLLSLYLIFLLLWKRGRFFSVG